MDRTKGGKILIKTNEQKQITDVYVRIVVLKIVKTDALCCKKIAALDKCRIES